MSMDPVEERRQKSLEKTREQGRFFFQFHGYQGWTQEDYQVFTAGYLMAVGSPILQETGDPEYALMFAFGFHDAWQDWQRIKTQLEAKNASENHQG